MIDRGSWRMRIGWDWMRDPSILEFGLVWDRDPNAPKGVIPFRRRFKIWCELPTIMWRWFPRAWGRMDRRFECGAYDACAWTGRDREVLAIRWRRGWTWV